MGQDNQVFGIGTFKKVTNSLQFHFVSEAPRPFSLNPLHSDSTYNAVVMDSLVGTLVKYNLSGRYEPFLASSWSAS